MAWLPWLQSLITFRKDTGNDLIVPRLTSGGAIPVEFIDSSTGGKAGELIPGDFSGNPKKATVTFATAYPDTNYTITLTASSASNFTYAPNFESKTASGFTVNLGAGNIANLLVVAWHTLTIGD